MNSSKLRCVEAAANKSLAEDVEIEDDDDDDDPAARGWEEEDGEEEEPVAESQMDR